MKNFRIRIHYNSYSAELVAKAEDSREGIEKVILDKLGKNEVKFEYDGFTSKTGKWITYEEVTNDPRTIQYKKVLGARLAEGVSAIGAA